MDETEYQEYIDAIDAVERRDRERFETNGALTEQIRDEDGFRVPGCFYVKPAPFEA